MSTRLSKKRLEEIREENRLSGGDPFLTDLLAEIDALTAEMDAEKARTEEIVKAARELLALNNALPAELGGQEKERDALRARIAQMQSMSLFDATPDDNYVFRLLNAVRDHMCPITPH